MFKHLDRLIIKELIPFWFFGVAMFTLLIMAGTYLFKLTEYFVKGIDLYTIIKLSALYVPGVIVKTFPMAFLLSTLLGFGRFSGDSEIVVLKSSGISFVRIMRPVALFGALIGVLTFIINECVVPLASIKATEISLDIVTKTSHIGFQPQYYPLYEKGRLIAIITAKDFNFEQKILSDVSIISYQSNGSIAYYFYAKQMKFKDIIPQFISMDQQKWELTQGGTLLSADGRLFLNIKEKTWPHQIPKANFTATDIISHRITDLDSLSLVQIKKQIEQAKKNPSFDVSQRINLEFGFWNKIAIPFTSIIFGLLGASLGTRNHRANMSSGFWISIVIIFGYMTLANFMALYAKSQIISSCIASFTPLFIGATVASITIIQKNK